MREPLNVIPSLVGRSLAVLIVVSLALGVGLPASLVAPALAAPSSFSAHLTGPAESPPNISPGVGFTQVDIDPAAHRLSVNVTFSGLLANTTASHIHACTPTAGTGTAMVATQTPSFIGFPLGVKSGSFSQTFDTSLATTYNPAFVTAQGSLAAAETALFNCIATGRAYLNIHSVMFMSGEIRGFLLPLNPATPPSPPGPGAPNPPDPVSMTQTCVANDPHFPNTQTFSPSGSVPPGTVLSCTVNINTQHVKNGLTLTGVIAGGGRSSDTSIVGSSLSFVPPKTGLVSCNLTSDQYNRVEYSCSLGTLQPGTTTLTYLLQASDLGCYRNTSVSVQLDQTGVAGHLDTSTTNIGINCNAKPA